MYIAPKVIDVENKLAMMIVFGLGGFIMICGNIFSSALNGSILRDHTPEGAAGKMQGIRMVASVLIPMVVGPAIGNAINKTSGQALEGADAMTSAYMPTAEIFLAGAIIALLALVASGVSIFLTVYYNKKKAVPVAANGAADTETDEEE